jgi:ubiquinone biosynthesis protein UbiJ
MQAAWNLRPLILSQKTGQADWVIRARPKRGTAYNWCMSNLLQTLAVPAVMQRLTLLMNHVLSSEPVAMQRLRPHAGRCVVLQFSGWPSLLPALPVVAFHVTPAGLLEWTGGQADQETIAHTLPDLRVTLDASNPALVLAQALTGQRPRIDVAGDAALAADVSWVFENVRWDVQDDLARLVGEAPARELGRVAGWVAAALREMAKGVTGVAAKMRSGAAEPPAK